ncbi:P-loop containing nucleoside triphosphate hydrolase protein [Ophiobolus disseminans]|uniref:P-loop containing nucleoside triphosphate hydrolase protein n=1 Tax=Ophiobolus disseminans TaxID=1469910 RepID=A0A6A7AK75_9PLEO|nr:P-loop containing nucleoside triphosphate hydrolase protein [Ophiobolus disseminans]
MASADDFTFIETEATRGSKPSKLFDDLAHFTSAKTPDLDTQLVTSLRHKHPELIVTTVSRNNIDLLTFAAAGYAQAELDTDAEPVLHWRGFAGPSHRGGSGYLYDSKFFARYKYTWGGQSFILYTVFSLQYILKEPVGNETTSSNSSITDFLLATIGKWYTKEVPAIYVYDGYWTRDTKLWEQVKKAKWDDVILDPKMKKALTEVANKFFDNKDIYDEYGVPWKRGLIFHGPVGNGKTISLKALMHTLQDRNPPIVTLYVKSAPYSYNIRSVFEMARAMSPCLLVLEDIDTIVTSSTRSYFFNEVDGLENNDGILMIATTNHLDKLDPGLSKRPSRFDRKYLFPLPDQGERALYAQYWQKKLKDKKSIEFPVKLCNAIAEITEDFSFAYLKEAFVATLLDLARNADGDDDDADESADDKDDDPLDKYEFWRSFKAQVKILRDDMGSGNSIDSATGTQEGVSAAYEELLPLLDAMKLHTQNGPQSHESAPHFPLVSHAMTVDPHNPFMRSGSDVGPANAFGMFRSPVAQNKAADAKSAVWGRDMV